MSKVFVIADLHFGHKKAAEFRGFSSVELHDQKIVEAWNNVVTKRDVVYVLGDVFRLERFKDLLGVKKLAFGNHDQSPNQKYLEHFTQTRAYFEYDSCLLSHIPIHESQFRRWEFNIHGHLHSMSLDDRRYICVSIEHLEDFKPVEINKVIEQRRRNV